MRLRIRQRCARRHTRSRKDRLRHGGGFHFGSFDRELAVFESDLSFTGLKQMMSNLVGFFFQFFNGVPDCGAAYGGSAAAEGADTVLHNGGITVDDGHIINMHAQLVGSQLRE